MRSRPSLLAVLLVSALGVGPAAGGMVDMLLAEVDGRTVAASDVALSRALGLCGLEPSSEPITRGDVERLVEARLLVAEARRLGLAVTAEAVAHGRKMAAARAGGVAALDAWLAEVGIERAWARRLVEEELLRQELLEIRFRAFAMVNEAEIDAVLGPRPHDAVARERIRERLATRSAEQALAEWIPSARERAAIRILVEEGQPVALPFAMPPAATPPRPGP
jgi:hypothetical protein